MIPINHSSTWYSPRPGHRPRFDPKKFRDLVKLNWSTEILFTLTELSKFKRRKILDFLFIILVLVFLITLAVVLKQGRRQSETKIPVNRSTVIYNRLDYYHIVIVSIRVSTIHVIYRIP